MKRLAAVAAVLCLGLAPVALATPPQGDIQRTELGRGAHAEDGAIAFKAGQEALALKATYAPGAISGWHRHPGAVMVIVKSGTLTTYGLDAPPCVGQDIPAGGVYFEDDAAHARWPHFVRNRGGTPTEFVVIAFNLASGQSYRTDVDAPPECAAPR